MKTFIKTFAFVLLAAGSALAAELPLLTPTRIVKAEIGGDYTSAMVVEAEGRKVFIKSLKSKPYPENDPRGGPPRMIQLTRWGNFEADVVAKALFDLVDVQCPATRVVRLPAGSDPARKLGERVAAMEFVDQKFARGIVEEGHWPGSQLADVDGFINMGLVDVLMGNCDRRDPNFFIVNQNGVVRPIAIDNNSGFTTFLLWTRPSNLVNFFASYSGLGRGWPWEMIGTINNVVVRGNETHHVHERTFNDARHSRRVIELARALAAKLTDAEIDRIIALVPPEIIPDGVSVTYPPELRNADPAVRKYLGDMNPAKGPELFRRRMDEIKTILKWRRSNLVSGMIEYMRRHNLPVPVEGNNPPPRPTQPPRPNQPPRPTVPPIVVKPPAQPPVVKPPARPSTIPVNPKGTDKSFVDRAWKGLQSTGRQ